MGAIIQICKVRILQDTILHHYCFYRVATNISVINIVIDNASFPVSFTVFFRTGVL